VTVHENAVSLVLCPPRCALRDVAGNAAWCIFLMPGGTSGFSYKADTIYHNTWVGNEQKNCLAGLRGRGIGPPALTSLPAGAFGLLWTPAEGKRRFRAWALDRMLPSVRPICAALAAGLHGSSRTGSKSDRRARGTRANSGFSGPVLPTVAPYSPPSACHAPTTSSGCWVTLTPPELCNPASSSAPPRECVLSCSPAPR
jgi:hypothetical protein